MRKVFLDVECYSNYFLVCFKSDVKVGQYEMLTAPCDSEKISPNVEETVAPLNVIEISNIMNAYTTVGFNSINYDLPMIAYAIKGASNLQLKKLSDELILSKKKSCQVCKEFNIYIPKQWDHIDLIEPAPAIMTSLKMYGARMFTNLLQDLPIEPNAIISATQASLLKEYCINDIDITIELYKQIEPSINLREILNKEFDQSTRPIDFRSKSDAQIAEAAFRYKLYTTNAKVKTIDTDKVFKYKAPAYIDFTEDSFLQLKNQLEYVEFNVDTHGALKLNKDVTRKVKLGHSTYTIGIGGIHSTEKNRAVIRNKDEFLIDVDVVSYYPSIIINNKYFPENLGSDFLKVYSGFYDERIKAKMSGNKNKSDVFKIILNGSFGKFGSKYSCLYSPSLLLHTTLTGQLSLLMLIESIENCGCSVISANTDGLTVRGKSGQLGKLNESLKKWEKLTNFNLEKTEYKAIYHESVNSYIAVMDDNSIKAKGVYANDSLRKNSSTLICTQAVIKYLTQNINLVTTIYDKSNNIVDFLNMRKVTGGSTFEGQYLGETVRWYHSRTGGDIRYLKNNNLVPTASNCKPLMNITDKSLPDDLCYSQYVDIAKKMLGKLGVKYDN